MLSHSPVRGAQTYRPDIDGLRAVAVGAVVLSHAGVPLMSGGFIGVDVFFVISGFLITQILQRELAGGEFSLIAFYERRVRRIFPALMVVIAATLIGGAVLVPPDALKDLTGSAVATAVFSSNLWFWRSATDYFGPGAAYQPLLHTWSLAVEEQFYIVYPLLLWWASRWSPRWTLPVLGMLTAALFATALIDTEQRPVAAFFLMPSRGWELGMGCLLALALARSSTPSTTSVLAPRAVREVLGAVSLTAIVAACMMYDETTPFPGTAALVPCLAAAALIGVGAHGGSLASRLLASRPFVSIGLLSYSLYLWHWPLLAFVRIYRDNEDLPPTLALACVVTATGLAAITWALVERPVRSRSARPVTVFSFAGIATVAVVTVSLAGWLAQRRFPHPFRCRHHTHLCGRQGYQSGSGPVYCTRSLNVDTLPIRRRARRRTGQLPALGRLARSHAHVGRQRRSNSAQANGNARRPGRLPATPWCGLATARLSFLREFQCRRIAASKPAR